VPVHVIVQAVRRSKDVTKGSDRLHLRDLKGGLYLRQTAHGYANAAQDRTELLIFFELAKYGMNLLFHGLFAR
jgi:hypothetical protein